MPTEQTDGRFSHQRIFVLHNSKLTLDIPIGEYSKYLQVLQSEVDEGKLIDPSGCNTSKALNMRSRTEAAGENPNKETSAIFLQHTVGNFRLNPAKSLLNI